VGLGGAGDVHGATLRSAGGTVLFLYVGFEGSPTSTGRGELPATERGELAGSDGGIDRCAGAPSGTPKPSISSSRLSP
jgi:hypothetical protein